MEFQQSLQRATMHLPGTPRQIRILRTVFAIVDDSTVSFNGHMIPVLQCDTHIVKFLNVPEMRKIVGPIYFIQLNKIYRFDIDLDIDELDHLYFTTNSIEQIIYTLFQFIDLYNGKIVEHDDDFIMVKFGKSLINFTLHKMNVENGYVVEMADTVKYNPYHNEYFYYANLFDCSFKLDMQK